MDYYGSTETLDRLVADPLAPIADVVTEVEHLCQIEAQSSVYYREHPELINCRWHPWLEFVWSGSAAYLGWEP